MTHGHSRLLAAHARSIDGAALRGSMHRDNADRMAGRTGPGLGAPPLYWMGYEPTGALGWN